MKDKKSNRYKLSNIAIWLVPLLLIVPNVELSITEDWPVLYKMADITLMAGLYLVVMTLTRNVGLAVLLCLPLIFYSAFQIVLLYLYGSGIIAVDMFLNVATTNVHEVSELLGNLRLAMLTVFVMYLPPLGWAIWALMKHEKADAAALAVPRKTGRVLLPAGVALVAACYLTSPAYEITKYSFPINTVRNTLEAVERTIRTNHYAAASRSFTHHAHATHPADDKEIYVLVVGETSRADDWQILGYDRATNPLLSRRSNLLAYPKALSESNTTHKSVPMILSHLDAETFGDSIYSTKGIISAFDEAGYATAFISAQRRNRSFIDFFGGEADVCEFIVEDGEEQRDANLLPHLEHLIDTVKSQKVFVVLHAYGSHFSYNDRYPAEHNVFVPADYSDADKENREKLINAYDNTIHYTDYFLDRIFTMLQEKHVTAAVVYLSDHGEDIFDDSRERFLHASPTPTYYQLHVPFVAWMTDEYVEQYPGKYASASNNLAKDVDSSDAVFHTMLDLAGISTPYFDSRRSVASADYQPREHRYLNDYNECVSLEKSGLKKKDKAKLDSLARITVKAGHTQN